MKSMESRLSETAPLSPVIAGNVRERTRYQRIPCFGRNPPLVLLVILGLLSCPWRYVAADQGGYYNDYGGYDEYGGYNNGGNNNNYEQEKFEWPNDVSFDEVSVLPVSCINYNGGHMIKFDLYKSENNYKCHFNQIGSFVVSIAHYMRAYFNYQAITNGKDFSLPGDAGYLNCVMLQETAYADNKLYAKIGCMDRQTFTSTKLQLHVYTDYQCSVPYDDGYNSKRHYNKGYEINGYTFSSKVSFRPPFYSCEECAPSSISDTFNKKNTNWYDDDYISQNGQKQQDDDAQGDGDDDANDDIYDDDGNDAYYAANDDVNGDDAANDDANDDGANDDGGGDDNNNDDGGGDDYYNNGDDGDDYYNRGMRRTEVLQLEAAPGQLEAYHEDFWNEVEGMRRSLYDNYYDVGDWNMCEQMYNYGVYCGSDCQALDSFRLDEWSKSDIFLLSLMCVFMGAMMILIVAKGLRAKQKAHMYGDGQVKPGLSPFAMSIIFFIIMTVIIILASLKFVNETLVFAVVTCILIFIYMLKLTLFERRRPVLLAAPKHDMVWDNPLDDRLFD